MSNIPTVSTSITNAIATAGNLPGRAIAVIGHASGFSGSTFDTGTRGEVLHYTSLTDWITELGTTDLTGWSDGVAGSGGTPGTSPYDTDDNLLLALALIYAANPSADVYACVLNGTGTDAQTAPSGLTDALDELLMYNDISYVVLAGLDPLTAGKSHVESAASSSNPYNSPRFYVAGTDLFHAWDGSTNVPPLDATDLSSYSGIKSDQGLVVAYVGNHMFDFSSVATPGTSSTQKEIGGQFAAAYLAGLLASRPSNFPLTNTPNGLGANYYDGSVYHFKISELNDVIGDGWVMTRFVNNNNVFAKGINYTTATAWELYPVREITNYLHKTIAASLMQFIGQVQTPGVLSAAQTVTEGILSDAVRSRYISTYSAEVKSHPSEVDAIRALVSFTTVKPINKIYLDITVS